MPNLQTIAFAPPRPLWRRMLDAVRSSWSGPLTTSSPELARYFSDGPRSHAGVAVSPDTALGYPAFWAAVSLISADLASLPLILYRRDPNGGKQRFTEHPLYRILHDEPNPEMTSMVFRETLQAHVLVWGNCYAEIERDQIGRVSALWPLTPMRVQPFRPDGDPYGPLRYRVLNEDGTTSILQARDVLHVPGLGYDGYMGYSVIAKARESLGLGLAMQQFGAAFFGNGSTFGGVFVSPRALGEKEKKDLTTELKGFHQGLDRAHRFVVLEGGMDYKRLGVPPDDAQFLESRSFHIADVARWFKVPPHKIGDLSRATFSNIEHQAIDYVTTCLRPWASRWQQEINRKLIAPSERRIQYVEHLFEDLLRGDIQSRYAAYAVGRQWGWLSADDVREIENMNPLPNGQGAIYLVPQNMWPADKVDQMIDAQTAKVAPAPQPTPDPAPDAAAREAVRLLEERFTKVDATLAQAQETLQAREATLASLTAERDTTAKDLTEAREAVDAWKLNVAQVTDSKAAIEAQLTEARTALEAETAARTSIEEERDHVQAEARAEKAAREAAEAEAVLRTADLAKAQDARDAVTKDLEAARALIAETEGTITTLREAEADLRQDLQVSLADVTRLATSLAVEQAAREVELRHAEERQAAAQSAVESAERRAAEAEQAFARLDEDQRERYTGMITAHRAAVVHAMRRMIAREIERARSQQQTREKIEQWISRFYPGHEETCYQTLLRDIGNHVAWMNQGEDPDVLTRMLVREHIEESKRQLASALQEEDEDLAGALYRLFERWTQERPSIIADRLMQKEIDRASQHS